MAPKQWLPRRTVFSSILVVSWKSPREERQKMKLRRLFCLKRVFFRSFCGKWIPGGSKTTNAAKKWVSLRSACFSGFYGKNTVLKEKGLEIWAARFLPNYWKKNDSISLVFEFEVYLPRVSKNSWLIMDLCFFDCLFWLQEIRQNDSGKKRTAIPLVLKADLTIFAQELQTKSWWAKSDSFLARDSPKRLWKNWQHFPLALQTDLTNLAQKL